MSGARKSRVLVVDDEPRIREMVQGYFEAEGFDVDVAGDGTEALGLARERQPDLVILDVSMPGVDGIEVLRRLRAESSVYVIMLTARADEVDKLVGLSVGADDYVTKPFSPRELVARTRAVLRRGRAADPTADAAPTGESRLEFDGLSVDLARRELVRDGIPVTLSALEFDLLVALARVPGRVFTRAQLLQQVWGWDFYGDERVVDVHIRSIRRALGDPADAPQLIGTVRGVGYKFLAAPR